MRYETPLANEDGWTDWIQPVRKGYKLCCYGCGLVHNMDFRVRKGRVQFRVSRNNRATGQVRRHIKAEAEVERLQRKVLERTDQGEAEIGYLTGEIKKLQAKLDRYKKITNALVKANADYQLARNEMDCTKALQAKLDAFWFIWI